MNAPYREVVLRRAGDPRAQVGLVSLPLPRASAGQVRVDHPGTGAIPVAWWEKDKVPRRLLTYVVDTGGLPETLRLTDAPTPAAGPSPWTVTTTVTLERLGFKAVNFANVDDLRGVPAADCLSIQSQVNLSYGGRTLVLQPGATGPQGGPYWWENVQIDRLWQTAVAEGIRIGGVIYNEDTYLWADLFLVLFANGVIDVTLHFVNTKLHIKGYDFQGLPVLRLKVGQASSLSEARGTTGQPAERLDKLEACPTADGVHRLPADGTAFTLGGVQLNLADAAVLGSPDMPGRLTIDGAEARYHPFSRVFLAQLPDAAPQHWPPGLARTVRFQASLADAPAAVARYVVPAWWYGVSEELWAGGCLPVHGACDKLGETVTDKVRESLVRGRFDAGSSPGLDGNTKQWGTSGNDGDAGFGMMHNYYQTGRPEILADALLFASFWADIMVDHTDFSVRQWVGGWGWKTCAYSKFRDVVLAHLETGDPWLRDTAEMAAASYWAWHRANWPRSTIGRDNFELGAWSLLWRYFDDDLARDRTLEMVRMTAAVVRDRGSIGGQLGAGPHPGFISALYMTGVTMISLLEAAATAAQRDDPALPRILEVVRQNHAHFQRDDVEAFPSNPELTHQTWGSESSLQQMWTITALRVYAELQQLGGTADAVTTAGLARAWAECPRLPKTWPSGARLSMFYVNPLVADAMLLGARLDGEGIRLRPVGPSAHWPADQTVETPWGQLRIAIAQEPTQTRWEFQAERQFPVRVEAGGNVVTTTSQGAVVVTPAPR